LTLAVAAARERIVLTRALRYEGEEAAVPSPLLLDALGAARIDPQTCRAAGAHLDQWTVTHEERPPGAVPAPGGEPARAKRTASLLAQTPQEAARDLDTVLYRYVHVLAARDREHAASFIAEARAILADADAPARGRFLTLDDPFAALPAAPTALQAGARLSVHAVNDFLYCPRRFFYGTVAAIRAPATTRMHFGLLLVRAVQVLLHLRPAPGTLTPEDAEDVLRLLWHGEEVPGAGPDEEREAFAGRFGTHLNDEAARALAQRALHRLARAESPAARGGHTCATGVPVEVPIALPDGRTVHLTAKVDRITRPPAGIPPKVGSAAAGLALIDYRSGASDATPDKVIGQFLDRKGSASWRPMDYTLPILFLGVAGNREVYVRHNLPLLPVRRLAIVALGADRDGCPHVCTVEIADQPAGKNELTPADLDAVRAQIAATVAEAAHGPHRPVPRNTFNPCRGCAHRFACPGPEMTP
ncbi:MAG TPA: PD-(D/E)XK nuclease family protein, partial [Chloroflexota bacterium]|nr:PD-(D/E)XK nuclease family protein [Chloroflexota bacterium]